MLLIGDLNTGNQDRDSSDEKGRFFCANAFDELTTGSVRVRASEYRVCFCRGR
jgi:hypothetical protein